MRLNQVFESTGCDLGGEVSSYTVRLVDGINVGHDLVSQGNSPRPGRSGGGLLGNEGFYLGIVWGTTEEDGTGYGVYVPLRRIHEFLAKNKEAAWLLQVGHQWENLNNIPIVDKNGKQKPKANMYLPYPIFPLTASGLLFAILS